MLLTGQILGGIIFMTILSICGYGLAYGAIVLDSNKDSTIIGSAITACVSAVNCLISSALLGWLQ